METDLKIKLTADFPYEKESGYSVLNQKAYQTHIIADMVGGTRANRKKVDLNQFTVME